MRTLLGENDAMAYLVNMAPRLVELHRVLKQDGSLYLHCDPTMSHYLKVLMDSIFGRAPLGRHHLEAHDKPQRREAMGPVADTLLNYAKGTDPVWNPVYEPYTEDYVEDKYRFTDPTDAATCSDNMTSPNPRPNMMYEWKGHASPRAGWRYSKETMARLDAEGRVWYPDSKAKRPRLKRYLDEMPGVSPGMSGQTFRRSTPERTNGSAIRRRSLSLSSNVSSERVAMRVTLCSTRSAAAEPRLRPPRS